MRGHVTAFDFERGPLAVKHWEHFGEATGPALTLGAAPEPAEYPAQPSDLPHHVGIWQRHKTAPPWIRTWTGQCPLNREAPCWCSSLVTLAKAHFSFYSHNSPMTLFTDKDTKGHTLSGRGRAWNLNWRGKGRTTKYVQMGGTGRQILWAASFIPQLGPCL